jgi:hypothetical protein
MAYKRVFVGILLLVLLMVEALAPLHSANAESVEVTVTVQRPADVAFSPQPGLPANVIVTLRMGDMGQDAQRAATHLVYVYLHDLQVTRVNSIQSANDGSQVMSITFTVEPQTTRVLTWASASRIPIRFAQSEVF